MEKKSKKELIALVEEQSKCLQKYKSRLHDVVESYKHLVKEKEALEKSIKALTEARSILTAEDDTSETDNASGNDKHSSEKRNDDCLLMLRSSLEALTVEKARIENELRTDRKKILQQKDELERTIVENENNWFLEREKFETIIQELKKKISAQQREREKEQQDHAIMLKELQNLLANERALKDKLEEQISDLQQRFSSKLSEKKAVEYEKSVEELQYKLKASQDRLQISENKNKENGIIMQKLQKDLDDIKVQYLADVDAEKSRADMAEERLKLLTIVNEKRIANLESRISELSSMVGNYDKLRQDDQLTIQRLKERVAQLQIEYAAISKVSHEESKLWEYGETDIKFKGIQDNEKDAVSDNLHAHCRAELLQLREELEQCKSKAESALKEKYSKTSAALLSDAKAGKEIKELKSRLTQLQDQLQTSKSQLQLNEEYHNKITTNLEKSIEELKLQHKQELSQMEMVHKAKLMELEHQIQKQRERTLALLDEKDKEICLLKSSFLSSFIKKDKCAESNTTYDTDAPASDQEAAASLLSNSLISSKKDGHILHYIQELSRKDIEISNLRHARVQTETTLRKLQQDSAILEEKYSQEIEELKSRLKLLESSQDKDGTNVEYLKNVVLRFLKCNDPKSRRHMVNAIATILHFTSSEIKDVKASIKALK